jgi:hypothetical protein
MATLQTKWVDRGSLTVYGITLTGMSGTAFGTVSNTQNGTSNATLDSVFSGSSVISLYHTTVGGGSGTVSFTLSGNQSNSTFATIKIGSVTLSRSAATYSYNSSSNSTTWTWSVSSTPFGASNGVDTEVTWDDGTGSNAVTSITFDPTVTASTEPSGSGSTSNYFSWTNIVNNVDQNSTINGAARVWYRVTRNSGSIGSGELGYTSGWANIPQSQRIGSTTNYTFYVNVLIDDDAVDETARQGESFTLSIYSHSNQTELIGAVDFTLYDADFSASSISASSQTITSTATSASVTLTQSQTPEAANPNMFVYNTSTLTGWYPSVGFGTSTTQTLTLPATMLPSAGDTSNYIIRLYNGDAWYLQQPWNFSITRQGTSTGAYGLQVLPPTGPIPRLDTSDRTIRVLGVHTGTLAAGGSSATVTQAGFSSSSSSIGLDWQTSGAHEFTSLTSSGTSITISRSSNDPSSLSNTFQLRVFKI